MLIEYDKSKFLVTLINFIQTINSTLYRVYILNF